LTRKLFKNGFSLICMGRRYPAMCFALLFLAAFLILASFFSYVFVYNELNRGLTFHASSQTGSIDLIVEAPPPDDPGGSGDGGGSGGGSAGGKAGTGPSKDLERDLEFEPEGFDLLIVSLESEERELNVQNIGKATLLLHISITKGIAEMVKINTNRLVLEPGDETKLHLIFTALRDPGIYPGKITFTFDDFSAEIPVLINIRSLQLEFDVSLVLFEDIIQPGENLRTSISLAQVGPLSETSVDISYLIKDFEGKELFREKETLVLSGEDNFVREFPTAGLSVGDYIAGVEVASEGGFNAASESFSIVSPLYSPRDNNLLIVILVSAFFVIILIIWAVLRYKKARRRLHIK
jgi:hypothetical protein